MLELYSVFGFFLVTLVLGYVAGRKIRDIEDFSVSHRNYSTPVMVATIFATVIGGGSTIGVVEKSYTNGFLYALVFLGMAFNRLWVGYLIAPRMSHFSARFTSLPEIMEKNYGKWGLHITALSTILVSVASVGTQTFAISHILNHFVGLSIAEGAFIGCGVLILYSSFGGMRSVIATDVLQFSLILTLIPLLLSSIVSDVGGFPGIVDALIGDFQSRDFNYLNLLGTFFALLVGAADPSFLQRLLVAKDSSQAKSSTIITGYVSILFYMIIGLIGIMAFKIMPGLSGSKVFIQLIDSHFPPVLMILIVIGILSAVMSSADSDLNMVGISMAGDHLKKLKMTPSRRLLIARLSTFFIGFLAVYVALRAKSILDVVLYAFSFWAPAALVPLIGCFLGYAVSRNWMIFGVLIGCLSTLLWSVFIEPIIGLDGIVPGIILHVLFFFSRAKRNEDS